MPLVPLTKVTGYRCSRRGNERCPIIRSNTHAPDQTQQQSRLLYWVFDLTAPSLSYSAPLELIFMRFRGPEALSDTTGGPGVNFGRFLAARCSTPIWWRSARFSSWRTERERKTEGKVRRNVARKMSIEKMELSKKYNFVSSQTDGVF
jgi:hypothetical protein